MNDEEEFSQQVRQIAIKQSVHTHTVTGGGLIRQVKIAVWVDHDILNWNHAVAYLHL